MSTLKLASIHPKAKIGKNVTIEPFAVIEEDVVIGDNTWIGSHAILMNGTRLGQSCKIYPGAILGTIPQDLKFGDEKTLLEVGNQVVVREYCTLNKGTSASGSTIIKDNCLLMAYVHVAHDCMLENNCIVANSVNLAGHIHIGAYARIGGNVAVHQFVRIGDHCFLGGGSLVRKSVPPYVKAAREPLSYAGVNSIGLRRSGFTPEQVHNIQDIYRILFVKRGYNTKTAVQHIEQEMNATPERDHILSFIKGSERGIIRGFKHLNGSYNEF
ncbi:MAG: acyl-ACP--UDP-N-acetylglucosamine O-acyltransferase [Bacteroidota bacterium]